MEYILRETGKTLEDSTPTGSLSINLDYWLDDFTDVFEAARLKTLVTCWNTSNVALTSSGVFADWPVIALLGENKLRSCQDDFAKTDYLTLLPTLPKELFTQKDDEGTAQLMIHNFACIQHWVTQCIESGDDLVLYFDGDS